MKRFVLGFIIGGVICSALTGFAVEYAVTANPYPVKVNGVETPIEGYNINDNTYFKLRDVADAVGGFTVGFADNTITIDTPQIEPPEPSETPTASVAATEPLPDVPTHDIDGETYVYKPEIEEMLDSIGLNNYRFGVGSFVNTDDYSTVLDNIPYIDNEHRSDILYIPYEYYQSTIIPAINSLR